MKLKSLLLGSAAALALSTGAQAADPIASFVSLDVCDAYGISGLTIASDDTCLRISGSVSYEFRWGDYGPETTRSYFYHDGGGTSSIINEDGTNDWRSRLETILQFEATTQTDEGAARAVIRLRERQRSGGGANDGDTGHSLRAEQAYVSFGDTTVLSAGMKPSIARTGHGSPYNFLGLVNANEADSAGGADWRFGDHVRTGGTGFSVVSDFGDGFSAGVALENINRWGTLAASGGQSMIINTVREVGGVDVQVDGTLVGFVEATGSWGGAHLTLMVDDALNGFENGVFAFHTGATANLDQFAVTAALAGNSNEFFSGVLSGRGTFDLFTLALSGEFASVGSGNSSNATGEDLLGLGFGASVGFQVTDTIAINVGGRYWDADADNAVADNTEIWDVALQVAAAVSDSLEATGTIGYEGAGSNAGNINVAAYDLTTAGVEDDGAFYGEVGLAYAPGGGFSTGGKLRVNSYGAYRVDLNASKSF